MRWSATVRSREHRLPEAWSGIEIPTPSVEGALGPLSVGVPDDDSIARARDFVLGAADPPLSWLALHRRLAQADRANTRQLFLLEAIEVSPSGVAPVLSFVLEVVRKEGEASHACAKRPEEIRGSVGEKARALLEKGADHPLVRALAGR